MNLSRRRTWAIARKELAEYRRNRALVASMAVLPLVFMIQPLVVVLALDASASGALAREHVMIYLLGIPVLVPVVAAAYAVAGERQQAILEPALTTPIRSEEFLIGKALAALVPSLLLAFVVYVLFALLVVVFARPGIAGALFRPPEILAQLIFTPMLAVLSVWIGIGVSVRATDVRVAQQLGLVASLPVVFVVVMIALGVVAPSFTLALGAALLLLVLDCLGWWVVARLFDRERLITGV